METSFDVAIWAIETRERKTATNYRVNWRVESQVFHQPYRTVGLAESFRSQLLSAAKAGTAFRLSDGLPVTMARKNDNTKTWLMFACEYVDFKWPDSSPGHRRNTVEAMANATCALYENQRGRPKTTILRRATVAALNPNRRTDHPEELNSAMEWLKQVKIPASAITKMDKLHMVLSALSRNADGTKAADSTGRRKRVTLSNALDYGVEREIFNANPLASVKSTTKRKAATVRAIDSRCVINPTQAGELFAAVRALGKRGPRLVAFYGSMYYAALRPEEAAGLTRAQVDALPRSGWGELVLESSIPEIGDDWTDERQRGVRRELKHRARGESRTVPCSPALARMLREHVEQHGTAPDGRLFRGTRADGRIGSTVYGRTWADARKAALGARAKTPLAARVYDLRHACVSTWLAAGVPPVLVAQWAGHSLRVLMEVYAKVLDQSTGDALRRIDRAINSEASGEDDHKGT
jgi:integrase